MMPQTTLVLGPTSNTRQNSLELLLQDSEWVETEFAAIMKTAGFGDRLIVGTIPFPPHRDRGQWTDTATSKVAARSRIHAKHSISRVRSPPQAAI
ncbi:hypothetical protein HNR05_001898 [Leifsonia psychrotolerans]|uniref:Uncharacterized protein n=1 Tax=Glaciibacter psychrotolerans TaxID=670054 RepID=A0A7Z0J629_9MICO|nr:hypothetical protein [Leifsonia psychrotolerans]